MTAKVESALVQLGVLEEGVFLIIESLDGSFVFTTRVSEI